MLMDRADTSGFVSGGIHYINIHVYFHFVYTMCFLSGEVVKLGS
ncbi:hypothetical protein SEVIR_7G269400v4 [Setaria viridis]|uniref:Uncharacterized protein n=2 Tax=Setaria TaxID=4554 RepID=A0A368RZM2_SETIT|nr:hypothetical protein SETIT_7G258000v2 [Setaria italica]TKW06876.1 hypothetical protein SEVIR_7G269400v2 [Setaria viridis]